MSPSQRRRQPSRINDRLCAVIFGKRGSGKTTLAIALSNAWDTVVAIDYVGTLPIKRTIERLADVWKVSAGGSWKILVPALVTVNDNKDTILNAICAAILEMAKQGLIKGRLVFLVDEAEMWGDRHSDIRVRYLMHAVAFGRHIGQGVDYIATSRRYADLPKSWTCNADLICCGDSIDPNDRGVIREIFGVDPTTPAIFQFAGRYLDKQGFLWYDVNRKAVVFEEKERDLQ